jgi:hypothetical protein
MFNSRNPLGKGFKTPLKLQTKDTWEKILLSIAQYLTSLETNTTPPQPLSTCQRKTFVIGFVACIKSTISMATSTAVGAPLQPSQQSRSAISMG